MVVVPQPAIESVMKTERPTDRIRVVVTGMGVVTPIGQNPDEYYNNLLEGVSGISEIQAFDCSTYPTRIAGEIKTFSTDGWVTPKLSKRLDKFTLYILTAGKKALADGGLTEGQMDEIDKTRCGVLIGSGLGGMKVFSDSIEALRVSHRKMNPFCVPFASTNMGSSMLAIDLGWMGPTYSISTACATSNFCILNAANHIIDGEADMMLCGGSEAAILPLGVGGFVACRALSERNNDPTKASRPWDSGRDGFVMGEGAGVLLLEELEHAKKRGANIYAEVLGGSFTSDAYHTTKPHPKGTGAILCMEKALSQTGVAREDVNYINAHATSTPAGDIKEFQAIVHCFGHNQEALSAKWEPPHGRHLFYPWSEYVKVGAVLRYCAYEVMALHGVLHSEIQAPYNLRFVFQTEILEATSKAAELIRCLSKEIHEMKQTFKCSQCQRIPCDSLKQMQPVSRRKYSWPSQEVDAFEDGADGIGRIRAWENTAALSLVTFTSLLIEFVARLVIIWL